MKSGQPAPRVPRAGPDPGAPIYLATRFRMPVTSGWHSHRNMQWFSTDIGLATLDTEEGHWIALPGQALIVASSAPHEVGGHGAGMIESVYIDPDALTLGEGPACRLTAVSPLLRAAVCALIEEPHPYPRGTDCRCGWLVRLILDELPRNERPPFGLPNPTSRALRKLCFRLRQDPSDPRDIDGWAAEIGMSRRSLTRRFRLESGLSFAEWRQRARVIKALKLEASGIPAKQIAGAVGYRSVQMLRSELRKSVGGSLTALRQRDRAAPPILDGPASEAA